MLDSVRCYDELAMAQVGVMRRTLTAVNEAELDWRPHPQANPIRWILGHRLWYETWVCDAIEQTGRFLRDDAPMSLAVAGTYEFWTRFDEASSRRRALYEALSEDDLAREFDFLTAGTYTVARLVRAHAAHVTGHSWQVRYVRGTFSRAFGTDKRVFDPF
jgi:hypothetical protein